MDNIKIGQYIREKRKEKGLTQQELGDLVNVSFKAVSNWECGKALPNTLILKKVCEVLDISVDELLLNKENDNKTPKEKNKKVLFIIIIIIAVLMLLTISLLFKYKNNNSIKTYDCTLLRTYNIVNINKSDYENYLYITLKQFQMDGVYTIKLAKTDSKDLEVDNSYEFTFAINNEFVDATPDVVFANGELLDYEITGKIGLEQTNSSNCY